MPSLSGLIEELDMDPSRLAKKMLEWESKKKELDRLEGSIKDTVLAMGKTQTVGNVRATYSKGRRSFDYRAAAPKTLSKETVELFTTTTVITDWKGICEHVGVEDIPFTQGQPSVSLKLLS